MKITIDGQAADIALEKEERLGDVLEGIANWLDSSGRFLSGLSINGETLGAEALAKAFAMTVDSIETLDIRTADFPTLMVEALVSLQQTLEDYEHAAFEERRRIEQGWAESPAASFIEERIPDLSDLAARTLRGEGLDPASLASLLEDRLRELRNPPLELEAIEALVESTARRMEDLPLDIQTGKDERAAETVQIFSTVLEKIFRLFALLKLEGFITDTLMIDGMPFDGFIDNFNAALKEMLAAYEIRDAVLAGDLAEYELAPRLRSFYAAIKAPAAT